MGQQPCEKPQTKSGASLIYISTDCKLLMMYLGHITKETFGTIVQAISASISCQNQSGTPVCQISILTQQYCSAWLFCQLLTSFNLSSSFCRVCLDTSTSMICCRRTSFSSSALTRFSSTLSSSWCSLTETSLATWSKEDKCIKIIHEEQQLQYVSYSKKHITALDSQEIFNSIMTLLMEHSKPSKYQNEYSFLIKKSRMKIYLITHLQLPLHIMLRQCHEQQEETSRHPKLPIKVPAHRTDKAKDKELCYKADRPSIKATCTQQSQPHKLAALAAITTRQE